jgi:hypothetical protein
MIEKVKVLLLATNQLDLAYVRLGDESREIERNIRSGRFRDSFELFAKPAVRVSDLGTFLLTHKPQRCQPEDRDRDHQRIVDS